MTTTRFRMIESPVGPLTLAGHTMAGEGEVLTNLHMERQTHLPGGRDGWVRDDTAFASAVAQVEEYFEGSRLEFDLEISLEGTEFQRRVWQALLEIPYGETESYGHVAARIGKPTASRAVGLANGRNPVAIIVPCHRVIGSTGSLTGYGGGLDNKRTLLDLERRGRASGTAVHG